MSIDVLDHATSEIASGSKLGIAAEDPAFNFAVIDENQPKNRLSEYQNSRKELP